MLIAIDFDDQLGLRAEEIDDAAPERVLSPKPESFELLAANARSKSHLGFRCVCPELSGSFRCHDFVLRTSR